MEKKLKKKEEHRSSLRIGGSSRELSVFPPTSSYAERDFLWRTNVISVDEEMSFSAISGYERILTTIDGEAIIVVGDERSVKMARGNSVTFSGGKKIKCFGSVVFHEIVVREGVKCESYAMQAGEESVDLVFTHRKEAESLHLEVYSFQGIVIVSVDGEVMRVDEGDHMMLRLGPEEGNKLSLMGDGSCVVSQTVFDSEKFLSQEVKEEKATFEDFKQAYAIIFSLNKWSKVLGKRRKKYWYDSAMQKKIDFLSKTYIGFIIWIAGILAVITGMQFRMAASTGIGIILGWTAAFTFIIYPLIYMFVLPKPIKAHIKKPDSLNAYEREIYEAQINSDDNLEKLLSKYRGKDDEEETYRDKIKKLFK